MGEKIKQFRTDFFYYVWLFVLAAVFGWLWEGFLYLFKDDTYVNRGFLTGPWLPIYGTGAVMLEILFHRWRDRPVLIFVSSMLLCTVLEYLSGWYLELTWGVKWWDYSDMPWNLHGRICVLSSVLFGLGGMLLVWVVSPLFYSLYRRVPVRVRIGLGVLVLCLFAADAAYSAMRPHAGAGITYR
ncbi:MAG: putative ABC transporter permease [Lachnospiraceae bacterium]|nr:putative ABC transporter permease [Lachnospiraceae bacterium]MBD5506073.1 putative ABC transporter permease [Lachnospiraceae bacterium]